MLGRYQAAIVRWMMQRGPGPRQAPTMQKMMDHGVATMGRSAAATHDSIIGLMHQGVIEKIPEDCRKADVVARWRLTEMGRHDLARYERRALVRAREDAS